MQIDTILKIYEDSTLRCYEDIKLLAKASNKHVNVRLEKTISDNTAKYIIELISLRTFNEEDYGIVIEVNIEVNVAIIKCTLEILKGTGYLYYDETLSIGLSDVAMFKDSISKISKLPNIGWNLFLRHYVISSGKDISGE
ncbi:MAG: hypothetical protein ACTHLE_21955 [Agriterribacter sp.]